MYILVSWGDIEAALSWKPEKPLLVESCRSADFPNLYQECCFLNPSSVLHCTLALTSPCLSVVRFCHTMCLSALSHFLPFLAWCPQAGGLVIWTNTTCLCVLSMSAHPHGRDRVHANLTCLKSEQHANLTPPAEHISCNMNVSRWLQGSDGWSAHHATNTESSVALSTHYKSR